MGPGGARTVLGRADAVVAALLVALAVLFVSLHVDGYTRVSPIDELQHIDYLYQVPDHPEPDDKVGQDALHQQMCRGIDAPDFPPPGCVSGRLDPESFQEQGYNTAASYTPVYYVLTRGAAEVVEAITPADDLVTAGRLVGGLWLGVGLVLLYVAGRLRGLGHGPMAVTGVLVASSPGLLYPSATIAPDATALAVGAGLVLVLTWWERRPTWRRAALLVLVTVVGSLVKTTYLAVVAALALYLLFRWVRGLRTPGPARHRPLLLAVVAAATALVATASWTVYVATLPQIDAADLPAMATQFRVATFPWAGLGDSLLVLVQPLSSPWVVVGVPQLTLLGTSLVSTVLAAGVLAAAAFGAAEERERDLARATLLAAVVTAAGLVVLAYVTSGAYIALPARYGMALVAPMAIGAAACVRSRSALGILAGLAAVSAFLNLWRLVALP